MAILNVSSALTGWEEEILLIKTLLTEDPDRLGVYIETETITTAKASVQPLKDEEMSLQDNKEYAGLKFYISETQGIKLNPNDIIEYRGTRYRVKSLSNYAFTGGYYKYIAFEEPK